MTFEAEPLADEQIAASLAAMSDGEFVERLRTYHDRLGAHLIRVRDQPLHLRMSRALMVEAARRIQA